MATNTTNRRGKKPQVKKTTEVKSNNDEDRLLAALNDIDEIGLDNISEQAKKDHKKVIDLLEKRNNTQSVKWLEDENEKLTKLNLKLEEENKKFKENYDKIFNDYSILQKEKKVSQIPTQTNQSTQTEKSIQNLYNEFKYALDHNWTTANLPILIKKFKVHFPFLK